MTGSQRLRGWIALTVSLAAFLASPSASLADVAALRPLLDRMTKAVLGADADAYMTCVDPADAAFVQEQKNWAADLKRKPVTAFTIALDESKSRETNTAIVVPLTMSWTIDGLDRSLQVRAKFAARDGAWLFAGEDWRRLESGAVTVLYADGLEPAAKRLGEIAPEVVEHVEAGFGLEIDHGHQVKLYSSMNHLQASIYLSYTDGLAGWNEPGESVKMLVSSNDSAQSMKPTLAHEFGHVATFLMGPTANKMAWWIQEGVAELAAERYAGKSDRAMRNAARRNQLRSWDKLSDFHNTAPQDMMMVYSQGHAMIGFISDRFGREKRNAWIRAMSNSKTLNEATREMFGLTFDELDAQWRESLKPANAGAPKAKDEPPPDPHE